MTPTGPLAGGLMLCASVLALAPGLARAETWLAFGDSLTDTGNAFTLTGGALPDPAFYADGRFSNGPVWIDRLAGGHGLLADHLLGTADPSQRDWNFAVGGATTGTDTLDPSTGTPPGLRAQVDMARALIADGAVLAGADTTAVLWAGANDHGLWLTSPTRDASLDGAVADGVAANIDAATRGIAAVGVGRVAVLNLFDFSLAPTTALLPADLRAAGDAMVARHSAALLRQAEAADAGTTAQVLLVDVHALFDGIARNPGAWGFDSLDPCLPDGGAPDCTAPGSAEARVFWDGTHLTSAAQGLVAELVQGTLAAGRDVPRLGTGTNELAFSLTDRQMRQAAEGRHDVGGWVEATGFGLDAGGQFAGLSGGWTERAGNLSFGGGLSWSTGEIALGRANIGTEAWTVSAFARQEVGAFGLTAQAAWGRTDLDLSRKTSFAPAPRASATTEATSRIIDLGVDYRLAAGAASLVLDGGLTWSDTHRDGVAESGGGLMDASIAAQSVETLSARLGATAAVDLDVGAMPTTLFARVEWTDLLDSGATGGTVRLASGQHLASDPVSTIADGTQLELGVSGGFGEGLTARASWSAAPFDDGFADGVGQVSVGMRF